MTELTKEEVDARVTALMDALLKDDPEFAEAFAEGGDLDSAMAAARCAYMAGYVAATKEVVT